MQDSSKLKELLVKYLMNNKKKLFTKRTIFSTTLKYNNFLEIIYITTSIKVIIDQVILMIVVL